MFTFIFILPEWAKKWEVVAYRTIVSLRERENVGRKKKRRRKSERMCLVCSDAFYDTLVSSERQANSYPCDFLIARKNL